MNTMRGLLAGMRMVEAMLATAAYAVVAGLLVGDVIAREVFGGSIWGGQKMAVLATVIAGFVGFTMVTHADAHLRVGALDALMPARWAHLHRRVGDAVSALLFFAIAFVAARFVLESLGAGEQVAVLYIPTWPFQSVLVYAFASSGLRHAAFAVYPALKPVPPAGAH